MFFEASTTGVGLMALHLNTELVFFSVADLVSSNLEAILLAQGRMSLLLHY